MGKHKSLSHWTFSEVATAAGQRVEFTCHPEDVEATKLALGQVRSVDLPVTHSANIAHGSFGGYSRYQVVQHKYAGGGEGGCCGYIEVLKIKNPPDGRSGNVIHEYNSREGNSFSEWKTLSAAKKAYERFMRSSGGKEFSKLTGFIRYVECGVLTPWFYAIGEEELLGDYALPQNLSDDPVFRLGARFVVTDSDGCPQVKTCMGTRWFEHTNDWDHSKIDRNRIVYWDDGSTWRDDHHTGAAPRELAEGEEWITEAVGSFRELLSGQLTEFTIHFADGTKFVGKVVPENPRSLHKYTIPGKYLARVQLKNEQKPREGAVDFEPTESYPDIVTFISGKFSGREIERIEILNGPQSRNNKQWAGVFHNPSTHS